MIATMPLATFPCPALSLGQMSAMGYLTESAIGWSRIADESGVWAPAVSWNSVTSLPSATASVDLSSVTFCTNADASRSFMKRVSAWMSTVTPLMRNFIDDGVTLSESLSFLPPVSAGAMPAGVGIGDIWAIVVRHV